MERALLVYPPSLDFMVAFLSCLKAGVVAVPVFPPNPARRDTLHMFSKITESSGADYALTSLEYNHLKKLAGKYALRSVPASCAGMGKGPCRKSDEILSLCMNGFLTIIRLLRPQV